MSTPADILKAVIEAGTYLTYRDNLPPSTKIVGKDDLTTAPVDRMITLRDMNEDPVFLVDGSRINAGKSYVLLTMTDQDPTERDNLQSDLEDVFKAANYSIVFIVPKYEDKLSPYSKTLRVTILL